MQSEVWAQERLFVVENLGKAALLGMQLSVRRGQQEGKVSSSIATCVSSLDKSSFYSVYEVLVPQALSANEVKDTEAFFKGAIGQKYAKHGLLQIYSSVGVQPPEPLPNFSDAEYKVLEDFSRTSAGEKLIAKKVFETFAARQAVSSRIRELMELCRRK